MTTLHVYAIKHTSRIQLRSITPPTFSSLSFFLVDDCIIQFQLAYLSHLSVMVHVFCYHLY